MDQSEFDQADLQNCASEPIHLSGSIQPLGDLIVVDPRSGGVIQAARSPSTCLFATTPLGLSLVEALPDHGTRLMAAVGSVPEQGNAHLAVLQAGAKSYDVIAHRSDAMIVIEFEEVPPAAPGSIDDVYANIRAFLDQLHTAGTVEDVSRLAAREVRKITGLDRALVYRFDADWNGEVIAEDRNDRLPSYLGLRFPASDIPAQARELYKKNRIRLIANSDYQPVPIIRSGKSGGPQLDLSFSVLRSVSPVHLQYMRNMETAASMSISLLTGERLWGLISCHNAQPARVPYRIRNACDFIGQVFSLQLAAKEAAAVSERRHELRSVQRRLLSSMAATDDFINGLTAVPDDLLGLTGSAGAAVIVDGSCRLIGETPSRAEVNKILAWLAPQAKNDLIISGNLAADMPDAASIKDKASGLLAIAISQIHDSFVIWFRPEVLKTVTWGGDPTKRIEPGALQIHPRKSFQAWQETVRYHSMPWHEAEIDAAADLRAAIVDIVLKKAEELAALTNRLTESNKELEAFSYSISHDLRAPFRHIVGYAQLLKKLDVAKVPEKASRYIDTIIESALSAGTLVDNLLSFSQMGRSTLKPFPVDVRKLVDDILKRMPPDAERTIRWKIGDLPAMVADPTMMHLVFQNLIENAVKFTRGRDPAIIEIGYSRESAGGAYFVRDNGAGFDMAYVGKLFGVFQRLHRIEEFEGTGIGLANVKRIIDRHGGKVWAEGKLDEGATIHFSLPSVGE